MKKIMVLLLVICALTYHWDADVFCDELEAYDFSEIDAVTTEHNISFQEVSKKIISGDIEGGLRLIGEGIYNGIFSDMALQKNILIKILLMGIISAVFTSLSKAFSQNGVAATGNYIIQISLISLLSVGMASAVAMAGEVLEGVLSFMQALLPVYAIAVTAGSGSITAIAFYELVLLMISLVDKIVLQVVFPMIYVYMLLNMMNYLSGDNMFTRIGELLKDLIGWMNKTLLGLVIGLNVIKSLICPLLDSMKGTAVSKALGMIPGVGNAMNAVSGVVIGSGALIKNTIGVTAMLFLFMMAALPVIKLFLFTYGAKASGALLEPIADKNYTACIHGMYEGLHLLLNAVCGVMILFMLTIAIICAATNSSFFAVS